MLPGGSVSMRANEPGWRHARRAKVEAVRKMPIVRTVTVFRRVKTLAKSHLRLISPAAQKRTVTPKRRPNADLRTREYLTQAEVERLLKATKENRWGHRDSTMILAAYRHGLRASELTDLRWDQVDFPTATLHVRRVKRGSPQHASDPRGRIALASETAARTGAEVSLRIHLRAWSTVHHRRLRAHARTRGRRGEARVQGASPHAAACLRLRPGKQGPRHTGAASLLGPSQYSAHRAVHRANSRAVQGFLEGLIWVRNTVRCQDPRLNQE